MQLKDIIKDNVLEAVKKLGKNEWESLHHAHQVGEFCEKFWEQANPAIQLYIKFKDKIEKQDAETVKEWSEHLEKDFEEFQKLPYDLLYLCKLSSDDYRALKPFFTERVVKPVMPKK